MKNNYLFPDPMKAPSTQAQSDLGESTVCRTNNNVSSVGPYPALSLSLNLHILNSGRKPFILSLLDFLFLLVLESTRTSSLKRIDEFGGTCTPENGSDMNNHI